MAVTLKQQVPAFRIDDAVLARLWRALEAKWAGEKPAMSYLTVRETVRAPGRRAPEEHEHKYQDIDELRRASSGPGLLRHYHLTVSSWGKDGRGVSFGAFGGGSAASVEVNAADAEWCREVVDTVLDLLRPHTLWYAIVHRGGFWAPPAAALFLAGVTIIASLVLAQWSVLAFALYLALLAVILWRERIFPAADILVRRRDAPPALEVVGGEHRDQHPGAPARTAIRPAGPSAVSRTGTGPGSGDMATRSHV